MAHKLVRRNKVPVQVKGELKGEDGQPVQFDFTLHCKRMTQPEIDASMANKTEPVKTFLHGVAEGWEGVLGEDNQAIPFNADNLTEVLANDAGMAMVCFQSYLRDNSAVVKN